MSSRDRLARYLPRKGRRHRRGQGLVEFALLLPLLLLVVLGAIDFGRAMFSWIQITNASREAAAYAAFNPNDTGGITLRANQETNVQQQRGEGALNIAVACHRADDGATLPCSSAFVPGLGSTITVNVSEPFTFFTPLMSNLFPGFAIGAESTTFYMVPPNGTGPVTTPTPTPSPSASPSPSPTPAGSATPAPTASPSPTPSPTPSTMCTVPNFVVPGTRGFQVVSTWTGAGIPGHQHHEQCEWQLEGPATVARSRHQPALLQRRDHRPVAMILRRRSKHSDRGQALVEFALILPLFLLVIFGLIDLGRFVITDHILSQAAREGARQAAVEASWMGSTNTACGKAGGPVCPANVTALKNDALAAANGHGAGLGGSISDLNISCDSPGNEPTGLWTGVSCNNKTPGNEVSVRVAYLYQPITPILGGLIGNVVRHGAATMVIN